MGRQIRFYLSDHDEDLLLRKLFSKMEGIRYIDDTIKTNRLSASSVLDAVPPLGEWKTRPKFYLCREADVGAIRLQKVRSRDYFYVDEHESNVVEFLRSYRESNSYHPGRVYYVAKFFKSDGMVVEKSLDFVRWAEKLFKVVRSCVKSQRIGLGYAGPDAAVNIAKGVRALDV